jgi:hypothetical protein
MKKAETEQEESDMRGQYDFSGGVRGKYAQRFADREDAKAVLLDMPEFGEDADFERLPDLPRRLDL